MPIEAPRSDPAIKVPVELAGPGSGERAPAGGGAAPRFDLEKLLRAMAKYEASDLHLKINSPPILRIAEKVRSLEIGPLGKGRGP